MAYHTSETFRGSEDPVHTERFTEQSTKGKSETNGKHDSDWLKIKKLYQSAMMFLWIPFEFLISHTQ